MRAGRPLELRVLKALFPVPHRTSIIDNGTQMDPRRSRPAIFYILRIRFTGSGVSPRSNAHEFLASLSETTDNVFCPALTRKG